MSPYRNTPVPILKLAAAGFLLALGGCLSGNEAGPAIKNVVPGTANAGPDTSVTISDSVRLGSRGAIPAGGAWRLEWDIGNQGRFVQVTGGDTIIMSRDSIGIDYHVLRISDTKGNVDLDTFKVVVFDDEPNVKLDVDVRLHAEGGGYKLSAPATDLGHRLSWEWKIGASGGFVAGSGPDTAFLPIQPGNTSLACSVRVTDDDGNSARAGARITVSKWYRIGRFPPPPGFSGRNTAAVIGEKLYVTGPDVADGASQPPIYIWDPPTGQWDTLKPAVPNAAGYRLVAAGGRLHGIGGLNPPDVYMLEPKVESWLRKKDAPSARGTGYAIGEAGGKIYLAGGAPYMGSYGMEEYDPATNQWSSKADLPFPIWDHAMASMEGRIYAVGGRSNQPGGRNQILLEFDPEANTWAELAELPYLTLAPAVAAVNGKLFCFGGEDSMKMYAFDRARNVWEEGSPLLYPVLMGQVGVIGGRIYSFSQAWEFQVYDPKNGL